MHILKSRLPSELFTSHIVRPIKKSGARSNLKSIKKSAINKMRKPTNSLARSRPRLIADQDLSHRISAAGLISLKSFMAQRTIFISRRNSESVHQMRVAIRRLRTVISILYVATADATYQRHNDALRDFARVLGQGRDQDIFIEMLQQIPSSFHHDLEAQERGVHNIIAVRDKFYLQIDGALQAAKINTLFDNLIKHFQERNFPLQQSFAEAEDPDTAILNSIMTKVVKRGRKLAEQDLAQRHRLRISLKYLRYALEFLALDRATSSRAKPFQKSIERLLGQLGAANDAFTASRIARESLSHKDGNIHLMAGMIVGWHGRAVQDNEEGLLKSWQKFKSLSPYWN